MMRFSRMRAYDCSHCQWLIFRRDDDRRGPERFVFDPVPHVADGQQETAQGTSSPAN
jgi:hypothetical protein